MYRSVILCDDCGSVFVGAVYGDEAGEEKKIVPLGIAECPDCGCETFREISDD